VQLESEDGKAIAATYSRPETGTCLASIVLVHQYNLDQSQWDPWLDDMNARGYTTIALDLRGHGQSDPQDGALQDILNDPNQAPLDVRAAVDYAAAATEVDPARVGVIGTSIGANLSVVSMALGDGVVAVVPLSPRMSAVENLAGNPESIEVSNVLCFAGELDSGGAQAQTCADLVASATGDAQSEILAGSSDHGVSILQNDAGVMVSILNWLDDLL
jgi:cephalosporin-C deacetylase-like acetyl esterase